AGWLRFDASVGLFGASVMQVNDELVVMSGNFAGSASVGIIQSNGVPFINPLDSAATHAALVRDPPYGSPDEVITFQINFVNVTNPQSFFALVARQDFTDTTEVFANPDVREDTPGYPLFISPVASVVRLAKYAGAPLQGLAPESWTYFDNNVAAFTFTPDTYYWCKYSLQGGDVKVKFWTGNKGDEPGSWLIEATDPDPRVTGEWLTIAYAGAVTDSGTVFKIDDLTVEDFATAVEPGETQIPESFALEQNFPNPFNPSTTIQYDLPHESKVVLKIYNALGQEVQELVNTIQPAGSRTVVWNGKDNLGQTADSGIYIYKLQVGDRTESRKMVLLQ
ncbi:MAG: T9SS type A sorting domain-containing protein, partial [bacterium]